MKHTYLAMMFAATAAFTAVGCASESAPTDEIEQEAEAQSSDAEELKESRGYRFASKRIEHVLDEIEANDAQRAKANEIKDRFAEELFSMKDDGKDVRAEALQEWKKSDPDAKAMHALVDERVEIYRKLAHDAVDAAIEMHGTLTPEQREEIATMIEERMKRHHR